MNGGVEVFLDFLRAEQARGVSHVVLDDEARRALRELRERLRGGVAARVAAVGSGAAGVGSAAVVGGAGPTRLEVGGGSAEEKIARLRREAEGWQPARALGTLREQVVFSTGSVAARLVLVGEAPGYEEERQGEPFVGPAGKKLDDILKAMGISRGDIYITNLVKNRPAMEKQATNNRAPTAEEIGVWLPFVEAELEAIAPQCVVALGATAAVGLLGGGKSIGALRGSWHEFQGIPVRATYHPSYLLRTEGRLEPKRQLWEDMLAVMERLGMPISEKQRGYFLPRG